ncbi:MAG: hypothetical protein PF495_18545, partial [Spirochaetales bacterium]|nr:hypothetical protein [Spirochaetales bacterium]
EIPRLWITDNWKTYRLLKLSVLLPKTVKTGSVIIGFMVSTAPVRFLDICLSISVLQLLKGFSLHLIYHHLGRLVES